MPKPSANIASRTEDRVCVPIQSRELKPAPIVTRDEGRLNIPERVWRPSQNLFLRDKE
jgi:hypothetical protein